MIHTVGCQWRPSATLKPRKQRQEFLVTGAEFAHIAQYVDLERVPTAAFDCAMLTWPVRTPGSFLRPSTRRVDRRAGAKERQRASLPHHRDGADLHFLRRCGRFYEWQSQQKQRPISRRAQIETTRRSCGWQCEAIDYPGCAHGESRAALVEQAMRNANEPRHERLPR